MLEFDDGDDGDAFGWAAAAVADIEPDSRLNVNMINAYSWNSLDIGFLSFNFS